MTEQEELEQTNKQLRHDLLTLKDYTDIVKGELKDLREFNQIQAETIECLEDDILKMKLPIATALASNSSILNITEKHNLSDTIVHVTNNIFNKLKGE